MRRRGKARSLRSAVILLATISTLVLVSLCLVVFLFSMPAMLRDSEDQYLKKQLEVITNQFQTAREHLMHITTDAAFWGNTARYMQGEFPSYWENAWPNGSPLETYQLNFAILRDAAGAIVHESYYDDSTGAAIAPATGLAQYLGPISSDVLAKYSAAGSPATAQPQPVGREGILPNGGSVWFFCTMPVVETGATGAPVGTLTFGVLLNESYFQRLTSFADLSLWWEEGSANATSLGPQIQYVSDEQVLAQIPFEAVNGEQLQLKLRDHRSIYQSGRTAILQVLGLVVAACAAFIVALVVILHRMFVRPVRRLNTEIASITAEQPLNTAPYQRSQEFSSLANSINSMLGRLNESNISINTFQSILNQLDAYLYVTDIESYDVLFVNQKVRRDFGGGGELEGSKCWATLQKGQTGACEFCPVPSLLAGEKVMEWENFNAVTQRYYKRNDWIVEWFDNRLVHIQLAIDITDSKATQNMLSKRLQQQHLMTAMTQSFISSEDEDALIDNALRMTGDFTGVSRVLLGKYDEITGSLHYNYIWYNAEKTAPRIKETHVKLHDGEPMYESFIKRGLGHIVCDDTAGLVQYSAMRADGVVGFMAAPLYAEGKFWGVLCFDECTQSYHWTQSDIQLMKLVAGVLSGVAARGIMQANLNRMSAIVSSSPQFISYVAAEGDFEYVNPGVAQMSGYTVEELMAGGLGLLLSPEDMDDVRNEYFPRLLETGAGKSERVMICKDGSHKIMQFSSFVAEQGKGGIGTIGIDITVQHQLERDLLKAKNLAEQSNLAKSDFLSRMSHEMRTPMNAIIGMTGIAQNATDVERKDYCLEKIDGASNHLLGVINDILDMSKIEAGKFELAPEPFELERMLQRVTDVMNFRIDEKRQTLIVRLGQHLPQSIVADEQRLSQVLTNLLSNAVKFTPEGGAITLSADLEEEDENGLCKIAMAVTDTGIGISPEQQAKLFNRFEQADGGISRKFGGTGLGLAITKRIVGLMDGEIWIESTLDEGATFHFYIMAARSKPTLPNVDIAVPWESLRVLAVDDAEEVRLYFQELAENHNFQCTVAESGEEACRLLDETHETPYNIIFVDYYMPGMDGLALTQKIKQQYGQNCVVIMISSAQWSEVAQKAVEAGVDSFLPKPLFASAIADSIQKHLGAATLPSFNEWEEDNCFAQKRILLAEDIEINREIVYSMLEHTGVEIVSAADGAEAVDHFQNSEQPFDLILMDIHMPEVDGYEATRRIRSMEFMSANNIPIVAMTANVFREDVERCLEAGMDDHVGKPVDVDELVRKLRKYLC